MKHRYLSVSKMVEVEQASDQAGHTFDRMMACAGKSLAENIYNAHSHLTTIPEVLSLIGSGNNGGDALIAMTHLIELGWECLVYLTADRESDPLLDEYRQKGGSIVYCAQDQEFHALKSMVQKTNLIVDGILGTGIRLPLRSPVSEILVVVNESLANTDFRPMVIAVDCPSGIDCDSGEAAEVCIPADLTVCMAAVKQGMLKMPAFATLGELVMGDIGLNPDLPVWSAISRYVIDESILEVLPRRPLDGHKGTFGKALIAGGSRRFPGAPILAGKAAFRSGAGWVEIGIPKLLHPSLAGHFIEATWLPLRDDGIGLCEQSAVDLLAAVGKATACLVGPGLGLGDGQADFIRTLLGKLRVPLVIDADGLKLLVGIPEWWSKLPPNTILTPHPGEMGILTGWEVEQIQSDRVGVAESFAKEWGHVVVLKGAFTVVASPDDRTGILPVATPALARAGTGDVLAGMITGLRAQGMSAFEAACAGVWLHAQAGLGAARRLGSTAGVLAGDLVEQIPGLLPE